MEPFPDASPLFMLSEPVLAGDRDVVISAATASGKTEAVFLPALSRVKASSRGIVILSICPLKTLINDQARRLAGLAGRLGLPVVPWHGDLSPDARAQFLAAPGACS